MVEKYQYIFLDRDGVINEERPNDYVKDPLEFIFINGAVEAIAELTEHCDRLFIVTNQRGIGRGVMRIADLNKIHDVMLSNIGEVGGRIDGIYFCSDIINTSVNRKPNVGMAFQIKRDFPEVNFNQSIMVGNSLSDIQFGNKIGMYTVLVGDKYPAGHLIYNEADICYESLYQFVLSLIKAK